MTAIVLYLISSLTRLLFIFYSFPSVTHDEADIFINGYLVAKTGSDLWNHGLFLISGLLSANSSFAIYLNALFFKIFPKTIFFSRLPFLLLNSFIPLLIYLITNKLTKNKIFSLIVFIAANFSPWLVYLSGQSAFNAPLAFVFLLFAIYSLISIKLSLIRYGLFLSAAFLSFNSYLGAASGFILLLLIALIIDEVSRNKKLDLKSLIRLSFFSLIIYLVFTGLMFLAPGNELLKSTGSGILTANKNKIEHTVWYERLVNQGSPLVKKLMANKVTVATDLFLDRYTSVFDLKTLFVKGDSHPIYGNRFGQFYLWELIFLIIGIVRFSEIFKKNSTRLALIVCCFIIFAPVPVVFQPEVSIALRAFPLIFPLLFLIGLGIFFIKFKYKIKLVYIFLFYLLSFTLFLFTFYNRISVAASEQWHLSEKILTERLELLKTRYKQIVIITKEPKETLLLYHFYQSKDALEIKKSLKANNYQTDNIFFSKHCPDRPLSPENFYLMKKDSCNKNLFKTVPYIEAFDKSGTMYYKIENNL